MGDVLSPGQCTADPGVMTRISAEGYRPQQPNNRWSWSSIESGVRGFLASAGINIPGRPTRTDMVFVSDDDNSAVSMSTFVETGQRVYCGLTPVEPPPVARSESITVWGQRRGAADSGISPAEAHVRAEVYGDMGPNPNRDADVPLPWLGNGANLTFEGSGITLRIPSSDGTGEQTFENVPDRFSFEDSIGGLQRRTRDRAEEEAELRRQGVSN